MRLVARLVQVDLAKIVNIHVEMIRNFRYETLSDEHALRSTKAAESGVGYSVGLGNATTNKHIGDLVDVVDVSKSTIDDCTTKILTPTSVVENISVQSLELTVLVDRYLPASKEWMSLT